jgi:hypothetical protein
MHNQLAVSQCADALEGVVMIVAREQAFTIAMTRGSLPGGYGLGSLSIPKWLRNFMNLLELYANTVFVYKYLWSAVFWKKKTQSFLSNS